MKYMAENIIDQLSQQLDRPTRWWHQHVEPMRNAAHSPAQRDYLRPFKLACVHNVSEIVSSLAVAFYKFFDKCAVRCVCHSEQNDSKPRAR